MTIVYYIPIISKAYRTWGHAGFLVSTLDVRSQCRAQVNFGCEKDGRISVPQARFRVWGLELGLYWVILGLYWGYTRVISGLD